ncbi:hypothetical protein FGG08_000131 [Glutinoglossum americanum]|uniref:Zn(2)-C6 fungal-type domain-containing protein n=1 Tax=Glutinoglossum americanum TaxID=1670608 RepID=A0A9P8IDV0_9PEZI|nr:hypothetical protein FGG08_000131 [Glutinoglossum americanum]
MMLSTPLHHQYAPAFTSLPSSSSVVSHTGHLQAHVLSSPDMDSLSGASGQYTLQSLHNQSIMGHRSLVKTTMKNRHHPYGNNNYASIAGVGGHGSVANDRNGSATSSAGPVRRRISRACDQCNQLRTKCDGKLPCAHCVDFSLSCEYVRERKKRGKASRKDIQQQQAAAAAAAAVAGIVQSPNGFSSEDPSPAGSIQSLNSGGGRAPLSDLQPPPASRTMSLGNNLLSAPTGISQDMAKANLRTNSLGDIRGISGISTMDQHHHHHQQLPALNQHPPDETSTSHIPRSEAVEDGAGLALSGYDRMQDFQHSTTSHMLQNRESVSQLSGGVGQTSGVHPYPDTTFAMLSPQSHQGHTTGFSPMPRSCDSPLTGFLANSPASGSPGWLSLPSLPTNIPPANTPQQHNHPPSAQALRYPVLRPLLPHIGSFLPIPLACDLLDLYFSSSSSVYVHPLSPYILGYVFRKRSFLHPTNPRSCSPALLASMLWVAAQTSDAAFLTVPPAARVRTCRKLLELTVSLLKPLVHVPPNGIGLKGQVNQTGAAINGVTTGEPGVAMPAMANRDEVGGSNGGAVGAAGSLDDVATYIHLACIVSASEYKAASLRWWYAACCLARELKLNRELPPGPSPSVDPMNPMGTSANNTDADGESEIDLETTADHQQSANMLGGSRHAQSNNSSPSYIQKNIGEEGREERRRIWWLLYIADRHLALCYNRPLALLDVECEGLFLPVDEAIWQFSDVYGGGSTMHGSSGLTNHRRQGPSFECTGYNIFGFFLPLMSILGGIVDLHHARNHPRFGVGFRSDEEWDAHESEISQQLELYSRSLREFEVRNLASSADTYSSGDERNTLGANSNQSGGNGGPLPPMGRGGSQMTESEIQTRIVVAYGTHIMHVLHILLAGKWDPINLLDDGDLWISSQSFISSTGHAVAAAEAVGDILKFDPDLSFMPFFFGIYLLQGSFLLLLIADKLQGEANPSVVKACETIVRAHEACVITLNTEYQRNFHKVMHSALAQVRGRIPEDMGGQQLRRRELLALYRWTAGGTGLAL